VSTKDVVVLGVDLNMNNIALTWIGDDRAVEMILSKIVSDMAPISASLAGRVPETTIQEDSELKLKICTVKLFYRSGKASGKDLLMYGSTLVRTLSDLAYQLGKPCVIVVENLYGIDIPKGEFNYTMFYRGILGRYSKIVAIKRSAPIEGICSRSNESWGLLYRIKKRVGALMICPAMTTRLCSRCLLRGERREVTVRENRCVECSIHGTIDRDVNASTVITVLGALALATVKDWTPPPPRAGQTCRGACYQHPRPLPEVAGVKIATLMDTSEEKDKRPGVLVASSPRGLYARGGGAEVVVIVGLKEDSRYIQNSLPLSSQ